MSNEQIITEINIIRGKISVLYTIGKRSFLWNSKDAKFIGNNFEDWDWRITDIHHNPGIGIVEVMSILTPNTTTVILSRGYDNVLETQGSVFAFLEKKGIKVIHLTTPEAVDKLNELLPVLGKKLSALIHSTC